MMTSGENFTDLKWIDSSVTKFWSFIFMIICDTFIYEIDKNVINIIATIHA